MSPKTIEPVAVFCSPLPEKFGLPRQSGLAESLTGEVRLCGKYCREEALRGLEGFDYVWLVWGFNLNPSTDSLTVRPPRLGGNRRVGVFASRSPFRPNGLGLSSVKIVSVHAESGTIVVSGADLADGTPIYDIKPYVEYADSHPGVRSGFVDQSGWEPLKVLFECPLDGLDSALCAQLEEVLAQDPRPAYHDDPSKEYAMTFAGRTVRFRVDSGVLHVVLIS